MAGITSKRNHIFIFLDLSDSPNLVDLCSSSPQWLDNAALNPVTPADIYIDLEPLQRAWIPLCDGQAQRSINQMFLR